MGMGHKVYSGPGGAFVVASRPCAYGTEYTIRQVEDIETDYTFPGAVRPYSSLNRRAAHEFAEMLSQRDTPQCLSSKRG